MNFAIKPAILVICLKKTAYGFKQEPFAAIGPFTGVVNLAVINFDNGSATAITQILQCMKKMVELAPPGTKHFGLYILGIVFELKPQSKPV